jgi:hypothetical protein
VLKYKELLKENTAFGGLFGLFEYFIFEIFRFLEYMLMFKIFAGMKNDANRKI